MMATEPPKHIDDLLNRRDLLRSNAAGHRRCAELDDAAADAINADLSAER